MKQSATIRDRQSSAATLEPESESLHSDPRWVLTQRIVAGPHFARSPLLSHFLLYVVSEMLAGRPDPISEHRIGVAVFGRPASYRTDEDNIVRNYARQLRKRLAEHFAGTGRGEPLRIRIPVGGYIPSFVNAVSIRLDEKTALDAPTVAGPSSEPVRQRDAGPDGSENGFWRSPALRSRLVLVCACALLVGLSYLAIYRIVRHRADGDASRVLWRALLAGSASTYIVPPDAGFNLLEDMSRRSVPLASYIKGNFADMPLASVNNHTDQDLRTQQYTDFVSMQIVATVARRPEFDPHRVLLRFPRDLRLDDLKAANALIIGSVSANPWAALVDSNANFRIVPSQDMESAAIVNSKPLQGEAPFYASHWNEPAHETYALILFFPNLDASGHLLAVEGLDVAGTEAAAELLFLGDSIAPILKSAQRADGTLRPFEILLRSTSIQSNAAGTQIIASRLH